jgi:hypothetical protein
MEWRVEGTPSGQRRALMIKSAVAAAGFALVLGTSAHAAVYDIAPVDGGIGSGTTGTNAFSTAGDVSQFNFELLKDAAGPATVSVISPGLLGAIGGGGADLTVSVFGPSGSVDDLISVPSAGGVTFSVPQALLVAGQYTIQVSAFDLAPLNSFTSYDVELAVTPLPAALALFGTALAGLGAFRSRRNSATA